MPARRRLFESSTCPIAAGTYAIMALGVLAYAARYHEPWRDESQVAVIGRDVPLSGLWRVLRLESHPPLVFLLARITTALLPPPYSLFAIGALGYFALLAGTHAILARYAQSAPAVIVTTVALGLTDVYAYELSVVVRSYGLSLGLALLAAARFHAALSDEKPAQNAWLGGLLAAGSLLTEIAPGIVAAALAGAYVIASGLRRRPFDALRALVPTALALAVVSAIVAPFSERGRELPALPLARADVWRLVAERAPDYLRAPLDYAHWWGVVTSVGRSFPVVHWLGYALGAAVAARSMQLARVSIREIYLPLAFAAGTSALLYACIFRFPQAELTQTVSLVLPALILSLAWCLSPGAGSSLALRAGRALPLLLVAPWFVHEYFMTAGDYAIDRDNQFSRTTAVARALPPGARLFAAVDHVATTVAYLRPDVELRSPQKSGAHYSYVEWSKEELVTVPAEPILDEACAVRPDAAFVLGEVGPDRCRRSVLAPYDGAIAQTDEYRALYALDCVCLQSNR